MQSTIITLLAAATSVAAVYGLASTWHKLTRTPESGPLVVTHKLTNKSVLLPREYSHAAVRDLSELVEH